MIFQETIKKMCTSHMLKETIPVEIYNKYIKYKRKSISKERKQELGLHLIVFNYIELCYNM